VGGAIASIDSMCSTLAHAAANRSMQFVSIAAIT
jgi:hypothetical protein